MKTRTTLIAATLASTLAMNAQAGDLAERRGYNNCVEHIEQKLDKQRPKVSPIFFLNETDEALTFFINATAWQDGARQAMRSECRTSTEGHNVRAISIQPGRYSDTPEGKVMIEVASRN